MSSRSSRACAFCLFALLLAVGGCGGNDSADRLPSGQASDTRKPLAEEDAAVERQLVTRGDIRKLQPGSAQRAFGEYWLAIDNEEWSLAVRYFAPELRAALDPQYLAQALRNEGQANVPLKPVVRGTNAARGQTSVRYLVRTGSGKLRPTSTAWEQRDGRWYLVYSATLDDSYAGAVQQAVQSDVAPGSDTPAPEAIRAAARAARAQAKTLAPKR